MTPREILRHCIHFQGPPRYGYYNWPGLTDTVDVFDFFIKDEHGIDPWGIQWEVHPDFPSIGIPRQHPVRTEADLAAIRAPDPKLFAARTMANLAKLTPEEQTRYRFVATSAGIWERIQYFYGMDRVFEAMLDQPALIHRLIDFCADFWIAYLRELRPAKGELDALFMFDDWGTQLNAMISPAMFDDFFAGPYRRIVGEARNLGMDFWLHSCGQVSPLIENFIQAGMDLVNNYQSATCGYEYVAEHFAGRIAFLTTVDTQSALPRGSREQVLAECRKLEKWGTPQGGLIIARYDYGIPEASSQLVLEYFQELDRAQKSG